MKTKLILILSLAVALTSASCNAQRIPLKEALKGHFLIGTALNTPQITGKAKADDELIAQQFNSIVAENCMKSEVIHPTQNKYNFKLSDQFVHFGMKNKMAIIGHALIWHSQLSKWFCFDKKGNKVSRDTLINRMREHIHIIVGHYKGEIHGWDVVNEAFEDDGSYRNTLFYEIIGKDYIPLAFQFAHEADPDAELYLNDFSMFKPAKCEAMVRVINDLKSKGLRIDGAGMQFHYMIDDPKVENVEQSLEKLAATGVKVHITEFDLSVLPMPGGNAGADVSKKMEYDKQLNPYNDGVLPQDVSDKWNKRMLEYFSMFLRHDGQIARVTMWGLSDKQSWKNNWPIPGRKDFPLLFDRSNMAKPVVNQIIELATKKQ